MLIIVTLLFDTVFGVHRMDSVISELFIKGHFYKGIIEKLPFYGQLPIVPLKIL